MLIYSAIPLLAEKRGPSLLPVPQFPPFHFSLPPTVWTPGDGSVCGRRGLPASHLARSSGVGEPQGCLSQRSAPAPEWGKAPMCSMCILLSPGNAPREGLQGTPLPNPNISFHLWTEEEQLCECPRAGGAGWLQSPRGHSAWTLGQGIWGPLSQGRLVGICAGCPPPQGLLGPAGGLGLCRAEGEAGAAAGCAQSS